MTAWPTLDVLPPSWTGPLAVGESRCICGRPQAPDAWACEACLALPVPRRVEAPHPCPDCGSATVLLTGPDELFCVSDRCGWSQNLEPAAVTS